MSSQVIHSSYFGPVNNPKNDNPLNYHYTVPPGLFEPLPFPFGPKIDYPLDISELFSSHQVSDVPLSEETSEVKVMNVNGPPNFMNRPRRKAAVEALKKFEADEVSHKRKALSESSDDDQLSQKRKAAKSSETYRLSQKLKQDEMLKEINRLKKISEEMTKRENELTLDVAKLQQLVDLIHQTNEKLYQRL